MTEIEKLILEVESKGATATQAQVDNLEKSVRKAQVSFGDLKASTLAFYASAVAMAAVIWKVGSAFVDATRTYQDFDAQLQTATGSAANAAKAYTALQAFATKTPYDLGQAIKGFIQLTNSGLIPSERALYSFGNTASGTGNQLQDMVEAVTKAAFGEFEPLRKFYVNAQQTNDKIIFSFGGVSTAVKKNARDIEQYFIELGEKNFADAMTKRMLTLGGVISNLGDAWQQLLIDISRQGADTIITHAFQAAVDLLTELDAEIMSGQLQANIMAYWETWKFVWDNIKNSITEVWNWLKRATADWGKLFGETDVDVKDLFSYKFPAYVEAALSTVAAYFIAWKQSAGVTWDLYYAKAKAIWDLISEVAGRTFDYMTLRSKTFGQMIGGIAKAFSDASDQYDKSGGGIKGAASAFTTLAGQIGSVTGAYTELTDIQLTNYQRLVKMAKESYETAAKAAEDSASRQTTANEVSADSIMDDIQSDLATHLSATDKLFAVAKEKRAAYDALIKAGNDGSDRTAGFAKNVAPSQSAQEIAAQEALRKQLLSQGLKDLESNITTQGQVIGAGYEAQKETILASTTTTEAQKKHLILSALASSLTDEQTALEQAYDARKAFILSDTELTETAKTELMTRLTAAREEALRQLELKTQKVRLDQASDFFGNIASIGSTFGEKGFKIAKAAAIAQATIQTYEAATGAYAALAGIPYIGPELGIAAAAAAVVAGAAKIAQIKAQQYTPAYAHGGMIPGGQYGLVGEAGPEIITNNHTATSQVFSSPTIVKGPAIVTSAATTRTVHSDVMREYNNTITNNTSRNVAKDFRNSIVNNNKSRDIIKGPVTSASTHKEVIRDYNTATNNNSFSGYYESGGMIPGGQYGLVGEAGPEIVASPNFQPRTPVAQPTRQTAGNVIIHNHGAPATASTEQDSNGNLLVILKPLLDENRRKTKSEITQEIHRGGTPLTGAFEQRYGVARKGT